MRFKPCSNRVSTLALTLTLYELIQNPFHFWRWYWCWHWHFVWNWNQCIPFKLLVNRFLKCVDDWLGEFPIISGTEDNITTPEIFDFFVLNLISSDLQLCTYKLNKTEQKLCLTSGISYYYLLLFWCMWACFCKCRMGYILNSNDIKIYSSVFVNI